MAWLASAQAAYAQSGTSPTIENTALAQWTMGGTPQQVSSNQVTVTLDNRPAEIQTFRSSAGGQQQLTFADVACQATGGASAGGAQPGPMVTASVVPVSGLRAGEDIYFLLVQPGANLDPAVIDTVMLVVESESGDRETFTVFETSANSGEFIGRVATRPAASGAIPGDCLLGVMALEPVAISLMTQGAGPVDFSGSVEILADPFGIIFDSETGEGVSDAVVTLVDAATGQPAVVFAADDITP